MLVEQKVTGSSPVTRVILLLIKYVLILIILLLPLISALTSGLFGRFIGREGAKWITTSSIFVTFLMSCVAFYEVALAGSPCYFEVMTWIDSEMFSTSWGVFV